MGGGAAVIPENAGVIRVAAKLMGWSRYEKHKK